MCTPTERACFRRVQRASFVSVHVVASQLAQMLRGARVTPNSVGSKGELIAHTKHT